VDDFAARIGVDPLDVRRRSLPADSPHREALDLAAARAGWKDAWHPPGKADGPEKRGVGLALHDWAVPGSGRASVTVTIYPDGSVVCDAPPGWLTAAAVLVAEALSIGPRDVEVRGSRPAAHPDATARAVWAAARAARAALQEKAGIVLPWRTACGRLGKDAVKGEATEAGQDVRSAPGAVAAEVRVDVETGVVAMTRIIAVQEMGLVVERRSAEADVERGVFAAVGRALYEEATFDRRTGRIVGQPHWRRLADCPRVEVRLEDKVRAVLRLGTEAPGVLAAISNAVHNAIGVRVPGLPLTPERVLAALAKGG
jgi:xanthine dehydrogenase YagR molybdenum-binding subunit